MEATKVTKTYTQEELNEAVSKERFNALGIIATAGAALTMEALKLSLTSKKNFKAHWWSKPTEHPAEAEAIRAARFTNRILMDCLKQIGKSPKVTESEAAFDLGNATVTENGVERSATDDEAKAVKDFVDSIFAKATAHDGTEKNTTI
jgi:hypothetical protein